MYLLLNKIVEQVVETLGSKSTQEDSQVWHPIQISDRVHVIKWKTVV
jgi:hypothetical protein